MTSDAMTNAERIRKSECQGDVRRVSVPGSRRGAWRAGLTIMEATMAIFIVGVALTTAVELLTGVSHQQRRLERRDLACLEASNKLERLVGGPWDASLAEGTRDWPASPELVAGLPDARVRIEAKRGDSAPEVWRIQVSVVAPGPAGEMETWASLVAWKYRTGGRP